ncbi:ribosomal protein small subunit S11 [Thermoplasma volcanium GSS1]|uniref:Small ribosomal subunit protein uS17 n=1 Tax=Thermoplasma volcanium (strain ATCC 51530 / DSM 4299 / JCM 9571 / NBRC 15438 / GSS1) TaxID=273116 RepID=RS17_THEVO|nr:30S ribosomal protein S17 [Thermoplasma volcanium]Q97BW7.1 RecName: Full=Small ribosomal subunit protein uS17; AltName: Full=30S ribosomal protein S17 [Thermoplasma volcanium GSS1]BAB59480.1 ribosomal protein small subunit S11 [Thermoplasma volcanium GSS1]
MQARNIGLDVSVPEKECTDPHCPFHGNLPVRGQVLTGKVISTAMTRSVVVAREYQQYIPKYERKATKIKKYHVHVPDCIELRVGDTVRFAECRKLAKTISFVVVEKVKQ